MDQSFMKKEQFRRALSKKHRENKDDNRDLISMKVEQQRQNSVIMKKQSITQNKLYPINMRTVE